MCPPFIRPSRPLSSAILLAPFIATIAHAAETQPPAVEPMPPAAERQPATDAPVRAIPPDSMQLTPIQKNVVFRKVRADAGTETTVGEFDRVTDDTASPADVPTAAAGASNVRAAYSNTLGRFAFGPAGAMATRGIADDIVTTAAHGCTLDRYTIQVTGDRNGDGSGQGPYAVTVALHNLCPNAGGSVIPGTMTTFMLPDNGTYELERDPTLTAVPLPTAFYLSVRFSRDHCGVIAGAPPLEGFSADRLDFPGFACNAGFGGFPAAPHASFNAEVYVRDCPTIHPAYRDSNHVSRAFSAGAGVWFADPIQLAVPSCRLTAYEFTMKGAGYVLAELRTQLFNDDPALPAFPPATRTTCYSPDIATKICRNQLPEPMDIPQQLFVVYRSTSPLAGPVLSCREPDLGQSPNLLLVYENGRWTPVPGTSGCYHAFDFTLYCEGQAPIGACCDMRLLDAEGEAVCRDIPKMNCPFTEQWVEGERCQPTCFAGPNEGQLCSRDDCPNGTCEAGVCIGGIRNGLPCTLDDCPDGACVGSFCDGGPNDALPCSREADCPDGACEGSPFIAGRGCGLAACCKPQGAAGDACQNLTRNECFAVEPVDEPRGFFAGEFCSELGFHCPEQTCFNPDQPCDLPSPAFCVGGADDGAPCEYFPPDGIPDCRGICVGGSNEGAICSQDSTCPDGVCERGRCAGAQSGCDNEDCCTRVCEHEWYSQYCCDVNWDETCASIARSICGYASGNDECFGTYPGDGARLVTVPGVYESDGIDATENPSDPGFCCHEQEPGAQGFGTVWYRFVATHTSVSLDTCCATSFPDYPSDDSLIQVFAVADPDRGRCTNGVPCSIASNDCGDGSTCTLDLEYACNQLVPVACNDDSEKCSCAGFSEPLRSKICVTGLIPGDPYYVMVAGKSQAQRGRYRLVLTSACITNPPLHNDHCFDAERHTGGAGEPLVIPFDLSGATYDEQPATFDCPGPFCLNEGFADTMGHDAWYDWTAPCTGTATIQTCDGENTPDTGLVVYEGCDCPVDIARELACSFFTGPPCFLGSYISNLPVVAGQCYKLRLSGNYGERPQGELDIAVTCTEWCPPTDITWLDPPADVVDARKPYAQPASGELLGIRSFTLRAEHAGLVPQCWLLSESANTGQPNYIESIAPGGDGTITLTLARPITPSAVTAVSYFPDVGSIRTARFACHPANVNADSAASPSDILALIDVLNGIATPPFGLYSSDIDHSGVAGPPDILGVIDLLNGVYSSAGLNTANPFTTWPHFPTCAGVLGLTCPGENEGCRYPIGFCDWIDLSGVCFDRDAPCQSTGDPVCRCFGITAAGECELHVAVPGALAHRGACAP